MAGGRAVRWLLCSILAAGALLAASCILSPFWIGPLIAWEASATLGRPVSIGRLSLHLGSMATVTAEDVVIGNPDGFASENEPFARIPHLTAQLKTVASLHRGALVVASVDLEGPQIRFIATADGRENYHLAGASRPAFGLLRILDGRAQVSLAALKANFAVTFATERPTAPEVTRIVAEAQGTFAGEPLAARFTAGLLTEAHNSSEPCPVEISVQNGPTRATLKGTLYDPFSLRTGTADFQISGPDMARLEPLTSVPFPITPPYELRGKLAYEPGVYRVTDARGRVGRSDLEGTVTVTARPGQRPAITSNILSPSADLRDILSLLSGGPGSPGTPGQTPQQQAQAVRTETNAVASPRVLPQAPLHPSKLDLVDLHLAFQAQKIAGASMPFDNLVFNVDILDGVVALHPLRFGIGQGQLSGNIWLTPQNAGVLQARADIQFERLDVARLLWTSGGYRGNGALNGLVHMEGAGHSIAEILGHADGAASLWMMGGNLSSLLVDLAGLRLGSALVSSLNSAPTTNVECFIADFALRRGVLSARTLLLETADAITAGMGTVDLRNERVDMRLRTQSKHFTIGVLPVPLLISGSLKEPQAAPDPGTAGGGGVAGALAVLPAIQFGVGQGPHCETLLNQARKD